MLPRPLTSFIGRAADLSRGAAEVAGHPLVTIVGPPGVGKTRLAIEVARHVVPEFADRAWFVDLARVTAPELVAPSVLDAIGVPARGRPAVEELARQLGANPALLVLDNCEHVREAVSDLVLGALAACTGLHVLASSRSELGLSGERIIALEPFEDPVSLEPSPDALTLFLDRARSAGVTLDDSPETHEAVRGICGRLDGLPLAIELAAARVRVLGLSQLDTLLTKPLQTLSTKPRRASPPQRSLRESIAWSYHLCSASEQVAWELLAVFAGSFDLAAATAVLSEAGIGEPLDLIDALIAKSILLTAPETGAARYRMLVVLREYGRDLLRTRGIELPAREAHAAWYSRVGAELETSWVGPGQAERLRRVEAELSNIREAADFVLSTSGHIELLSGLVVLPAAELWWATGRLDEGLYWLRRAVTACHEADDLRFHLLSTAGTFALALGLLDEGGRYVRELRVMSRDSADAFRLGAMAFVAGFEAIQRRHFRLAVEILRNGIRATDGHDELVRVSLRNRQMLTFALNGLRRDVEAAQVCDEIIAIARAPGDAYYCAFANQMHALYAWRHHDPEAARSRAHAALLTSLDFPNRPENVDLLLICALIDERWGDRARAAQLLAAANATDRIGLRPATLGAEDVAYAASRLSSSPDEEVARAQGRALSARQAIELAIATGSDSATTAPKLTSREAGIARMITFGMANKQIAAELGLSTKTVEGHITRLMAKLGARSRVQVATWMSHQDDQPTAQTSMR